MGAHLAQAEVYLKQLRRVIRKTSLVAECLAGSCYHFHLMTCAYCYTIIMLLISCGIWVRLGINLYVLYLLFVTIYGLETYH